MSALPLFPTTVIGSMPRPQYVKDLLIAAPRDENPDAAWYYLEPSEAAAALKGRVAFARGVDIVE